MQHVNDFPKVECPFVREETEAGYLAQPEVNQSERYGGSYDWVFEDDRVKAVEKLHGTNVSILVQNGSIVGVWNRENRIPAWSGHGNHRHIHEGIIHSQARGYTEKLTDGQHFGELVGPKVNGNPYDLEQHVWIPFTSYAQRTLEYESWGKYPKTFDAIEGWFDAGLIPLFYSQWHGVDFDTAQEEGFVEGIVFTHPEPSDIDTIPYAKVRYDMFDVETQK